MQKGQQVFSSKKMTEVRIYETVCSEGRSFIPFNFNKVPALLVNTSSDTHSLVRNLGLPVKHAVHWVLLPAVLM